MIETTTGIISARGGHLAGGTTCTGTLGTFARKLVLIHHHPFWYLVPTVSTREYCIHHLQFSEKSNPETTQFHFYIPINPNKNIHMFYMQLVYMQPVFGCTNNLIANF